MDTDCRADAIHTAGVRPLLVGRPGLTDHRSRMTRALLLTNQPPVDGQPGYEAGLRTLVENTELEGCDIVPAISGASETTADRCTRIARAIDASRADVVLCLSLKNLVPVTVEVAQSLADRRVLYWEGDAWGGRKRLPPATSDWLRISSIVYTVAGPPQTQLLLAHGAHEVRQTLHTYDQTLFGAYGGGHQDVVSVVLAGNNLSRLPGVSGLPGSFARRRLVTGLHRRFGAEFRLAGRGWPRALAASYVPYPQIGSFIGTGRIMAAWEHFPTFSAYASDRLAVCMITGRVQVTSKPTPPWWVPPGLGVYAMQSWQDVLAKVEELAARPPSQVRESGRAAHEWARGRISHLEALRQMLNPVAPEIQPPPTDPWGQLPGPWLNS